MNRVLAVLPALVVSGVGLMGLGFARGGVDVEGTLSPAGAPVGAPVRVDAGRECVVDLTQRYAVAGGLEGGMEIDYRILVHGPCGSPPGTYDEEWIAHGTFVGTLTSDSVSATFVYTAKVRDNGRIRGKMVFGDGLDGALTVEGRFADGKVSYSGSLKGDPGARSPK